MSDAMKVFTIKRIALNPDVTLGVFIDEKTPFALTLERPWLDNRPKVSCVPKGEYLVQRTVRPIHGNTWEVLNVPNRSAILIHKGNFVHDSEGCIILGESFEDTLSAKSDRIETTVQSSGKAYSEFMIRLTGKDQFKLIIVEC